MRSSDPILVYHREIAADFHRWHGGNWYALPGWAAIVHGHIFLNTPGTATHSAGAIIQEQLRQIMANHAAARQQLQQRPHRPQETPDRTHMEINRGTVSGEMGAEYRTEQVDPRQHPRLVALAEQNGLDL